VLIHMSRGIGKILIPGGPLKVSMHPPGDPLCDAVIEAAGST
jgi:hypothetical protein